MAILSKKTKTDTRAFHNQTWEVTIQTMNIDDVLHFVVANDTDVILGSNGLTYSLSITPERDVYECITEIVVEKYEFTSQQLLFEVMASINRIK